MLHGSLIQRPAKSKDAAAHPVLRHLCAVLFFLFVASCSGGGCSGCTGCGGTTPLPGGFPPDKAVENAASVRVSRPGLDFVEDNLPGIVAQTAGAKGGKLTFSIPETSFNQNDVFTFGFCPVCVHFDMVGKFCPGGPNPNASPPKCTAEIDIGGTRFTIDAVKPNALVLNARIPLQLDDTPVNVDINPGPALTLSVGYGANGTCTGSNKSKASVGPKDLPVKVTIPLIAESIDPRTGYSKIDVDNASVDLSAVSGSDVRICADCGILSNVAGYNICDSVLNAGFIKDFIVDKVKSGLDGQVKGLLRDQLCTKPVPALDPACPEGSKPDASKKHCVYVSAPSKCVPMLLGTDAHVDLGGFLAGISPGTAGALDFGLAAGGPMIPAPGTNVVGGHTENGITLGMMGGVIPQPPSSCVPQAKVVVPTDIPIPDEIAPTKVDTSATPHVGLALAGRFLDYALTSVYNSGLLCLGVSTEQVALLKSGLLSLLVPSLKTLTFEQADAAAAISTRPQKPPSLALGGGTNVDTDPLLTISLPSFAVDIFVWSFDRFVRVFTYTADLTIPVNLETGKDPQKNPKGGILPAIGAIKVANGKVENNELLFEDPKAISGALTELLGGFSKQIVGSGFSPIDVSGALSSVGLTLEVDGIKKLSKGDDDFIGIFATMGKAPPTAMPEADTTAKLASLNVDKTRMQLDTFTPESAPELVVDLGSSLDDGARTIEYSWWIDHGTRSPWTTSKHLTIRDQQLFLQGKHVLFVSSRVAGDLVTEDATPAEVPFTIDALAPFVKVEKDGAAAKVTAWDLVSPTDALVARYRLDDQPFGGWIPVSDLASIEVGAAEDIELEVKDEDGNVGTVRQSLVRGRADPSITAAGSGCGCSQPGKRPDGASSVLAFCLALGGLSFLVVRRRRGARAAAPIAALATTLAVASTSQGCACGDEGDGGTGCGSDCNQECRSGIGRGQPGAYTSVAKKKDGSIWVAGYNDGLFSEGDSFLWGDLVVGKYDLGKKSVDWTTVDGIPKRDDGTCPDYEPDGWRRGELDSGDNVGRWPSIQMSSGEKPMVSYYDDTNNRLKFAIDDGGWKTFVVLEGPKADIGRYSKMLIVDKKPVVLFMVLEPGTGGHSRSKVMVARSKVEEPHDAKDFTFEDAAVDPESPCRADTCEGTDKCVKATGVCSKVVKGCTPADCGSGKACVMQDGKATCAALVSDIETYPRGLGAYISAQEGPNGIGAVFYDAYRGNLVALIEKTAGKWDSVILDGETGLRSNKTARDTGDVGIAASLAIADDGQWYVSYVNGIDETLRFITFKDGKVGKSQVVDDGTEVNGKTFPDGRHVVGDDSAIRVDGGLVTIIYTDSSSLGVRKATGAVAGGERKWDLRTIELDKTWVLFPTYVPGDDKVMAFWRQSTASTKTVEGDVIMLP